MSFLLPALPYILPPLLGGLSSMLFGGKDKSKLDDEGNYKWDALMPQEQKDAYSQILASLMKKSQSSEWQNMQRGAAPGVNSYLAQNILGGSLLQNYNQIRPTQLGGSAFGMPSPGGGYGGGGPARAGVGGPGGRSPARAGAPRQNPGGGPFAPNPQNLRA